MGGEYFFVAVIVHEASDSLLFFARTDDQNALSQNTIYTHTPSISYTSQKLKQCDCTTPKPDWPSFEPHESNTPPSALPYRSFPA